MWLQQRFKGVIGSVEFKGLIGNAELSCQGDL
ncbi:hypothetical protein T11_2863 [Trichinella zimbabwensis]|uniref:Uncharacterized protein n=1 Tax=Trichinella zimbabwensis TaxID=268475 RepID=A0A0V1G9M2_9BILA|nr:hypothetical protein T11_2863 [Trichinella zimbabwensis]